MNKLFKAALTLNAAGIVRATRYGPREAARRLIDSYEKIAPFGGPIEPAPEVVRQLLSIPTIDLENISAKSPVVRIDSRQKYGNGALPNRDLMALLTLLIDWNPSVALEIGTFNGSTTAAMALNAPQAVIHTVDLPLDYNPADEKPGAIPKDDFHLIEGRRVGAAYASLPEITNIVQHFADSATWDFAPVKGASFFFIDGAHTYEYAKNDTEKCIAVSALKSRFILHDVDARHPDVVRYIFDLKNQGVPVSLITNTSIAFFDRT
jgi:hypothetical protein